MGAQTAESSLGLYFSSLKTAHPLKRASETHLAERIRQGDTAARNELVQANLRFVVDIAKQYQNRGLELSDLIGAGNLGLVTAAERYDGDKGVKFISYAVWWIRQAILHSIAEQGRVVRLPYNKQGLLRRIKRLTRQQADGVWDRAKIAGRLGVSEADIADTLNNEQDTLSLDAPLAADDSRTLLESLADPAENGADAPFWREWARDELTGLLDSLGARERYIVRHYYGLDGVGRLSLEEIGSHLGITRERVRQIKRHTLAKLCSPARAGRLRAAEAHI